MRTIVESFAHYFQLIDSDINEKRHLCIANIYYKLLRRLNEWCVT